MNKNARSMKSFARSVTKRTRFVRPKPGNEIETGDNSGKYTVKSSGNTEEMSDRWV